MLEDVKSILKTIKESSKNPNELKIILEMPLKGGIEISAKKTDLKGEASVSVPSKYAKTFFKFAKYYKQENPNKKWNIMHIELDKSDKLTVKPFFDEEYQKKVEELIK